MTSVFLTTDRKYQFVEPSNGEDFSLEELQKFVGGYIEIVSLPNDKIMVANEEGKCYNLPLNVLATHMMQQIGRNDTIVGNVLICDADKVK